MLSKSNPACFLAPIHSPKFEYGLNFVRSYNQYYNDGNVFLVFSSDDEAEEFYKLAKGLRYESIVYYKVKSTGIITEKKFYGLQYIFNFTKFMNVAVVDIDSAFIRTVDYPAMFDQYNQHGTLWGNAFDYAPSHVISSPMKFFNQVDQYRLKEILQDFRVYFWFNNIPVYNKKHFLDFVEYIDYNSRYKELLWYDFDYLIYVYYMLIKGLMTIKPCMIDNTTVLNDLLLEGQHRIPTETFNKIFTEIKPMWIKKPIEPELMTNVFMQVNLDRTDT